MESYLMMIYVTLEQESALKTFFLDQGWAFCKPDLSYTTDKLGPAAGTFPNIVRDDEFINNPSLKSLNEQSSKRKLQPPYASPSKFKRSKMTKSSEKVLDELGDNFEKQDDATHETDGADKERVVRKMPTPITVQDIDGNSKAIKVEVTDDDDKYDPAGSTADDISAMNDDYNGDTDLEDSYGPEGGMLDDSQMSRSSHLDASLNTDEDDSQASGSKQKHDSETKQSPFTEKVVYKCSRCSQVYQSEKSLKRHVITHSDKKPFICHVCGAGFFRKTILDEHVASHDKTNPRLVCTYCGQRFVRKSSLYCHSLSHRPKTEWFKCETCGKLFKSKGLLLKHQRIHAEKQQCEKCKKWFKQLHQHIRNCGNEGEPYLSCKHCGKLLKNNKCLAEHVKYNHTHKKSYVCSRCDKTYNHRASLFQHKKTCCDPGLY
ncbi:zinc finger protein 419-like isoform X2 [Mercenaria mercenaria]|uniref:zinc finger protein 419-like isoform X2 n=1 Tax=Mercenaria mercenaria TaxID=6596 RepID=UPI00234F3388|nr:zinc finger protein 419-like isoform X2 [Mercenaria mercenaria]